MWLTALQTKWHITKIVQGVGVIIILFKLLKLCINQLFMINMMSNENIEIGENSGDQSAQADTGHFFLHVKEYYYLSLTGLVDKIACMDPWSCDHFHGMMHHRD